jgi:hypothetical protein
MIGARMMIRPKVPDCTPVPTTAITTIAARIAQRRVLMISLRKLFSMV